MHFTAGLRVNWLQDVLKTVVQTWYFHRPLRAIVSWYTEMQDARANQVLVSASSFVHAFILPA